MTAFVNAHTHLYSGLASFGLPSPSPQPEKFIDVLRLFWWRLDRALDEHMLKASAYHYVAGALLHGTHTLVDHHESPCFIEGSLDVLADACQDLGMRAVLCYGATERNEGRAEARRGLAECRRFIRDNRRPLVGGVVGLHAPFTVSDDTIRDAAQLCRELDTVLHVHVGEDPCDVEDARRRGYRGLVDRLRRLGALIPGSIFAHGVHLTRDEVTEVAAAGCWLVQNPRSNAQNRVGYPLALEASPLVALGTDGFPSDMTAEYLAGARLSSAQGQPGSKVKERLEAGTRMAAERFGWRDDEVQAGRQGASGIVDRLVIAGRTVVADGDLQTGDWSSISVEAASQAQRLSARMREIH